MHLTSRSLISQSHLDSMYVNQVTYITNIKLSNVVTSQENCYRILDFTPNTFTQIFLGHLLSKHRNKHSLSKILLHWRISNITNQLHVMQIIQVHKVPQWYTSTTSCLMQNLWFPWRWKWEWKIRREKENILLQDRGEIVTVLKWRPYENKIGYNSNCPNSYFHGVAFFTLQ